MDHLGLAKAALMAGEIVEACRQAEVAWKRMPRDPETLLLVAELHARHGDREIARRTSRDALDASADAESLLRRATAVYELGFADVAEAAFRRAQQRRPGDDNLRFRYAVYLLVTGRPDACLAIADVLVHRDSQAEVHALRGLALRRLGQLDNAILAFQSALRHDPARSEWWCHVGDLRLDQRRLPEAIRAYRNALDAVTQSKQPAPERVAYPMLRLADAFARSNLIEEAWTFSEQALNLAPGDARAAFSDLHLLPIIYESESSLYRVRARYQARLDGLLGRIPLRTQAERSAAVAAIRLPFYLHYQGGDVSGLMRQFGAVVHTILEAWRPDLTAAIPMPPIDGKIRVGFASYLLKRHTVTKLFAAWIRGLDRSRFEVFVYNLGPDADDTTRALQACADVYTHLPGLESASICLRLRQDRLHALIFPELGMATSAYVLAGLRSAPVQAVAWGHPVTTGLPNVDLFLSSAAMEPHRAQAHYTERLVELPGISVQVAAPMPPNPRTRADFGLQDRDLVLLVPQSLFKLLPADDRSFARIAARIPNARLVFIRHSSETVTAAFRARISEALQAEGLDPDAHLTLLPPLDWADYLALNKVADVFLDALTWSGGMTTLEAVAMDLVPVTCAGPVMRARHTAAILREMDLGALVADSPDGYEDIAVRVATDGAYRARCVQTLRARREGLTQDPRVLPGLERAIVEAVHARAAVYQRNPTETSGAR